VSSFARRLDEVDPPRWLKDIMAPARAVMEAVNHEMVRVDQAIADIVREDPVVQRLCTAPGIGPVTAIAFVATLDEVQRFEGANQVRAYLGLVPSEFSSGERQQRGAITKTGNTRLRWLLIEAAWSIMRSRHPRTEELRRWTQAIAQRRGQRIAIVALGRKLAGILFAMWRDGTAFGDRSVSLARSPARVA
jgi:transposase